ncbi:MAG: flagellar hook protein FlgE [Magnetococcales bacterium]|nr:flagellar hook protein FlgE [Magnetococcales bacterium]
MSIMQAMYSGSSALINFGEAMTVIGNNLANANTTAFKASTSSFEDVLVQSVGSTGSGAQKQVGTGVGLADITQNMSQGAFLSTASVTDLSIDGKGFFMVKDPALSTKLDVSGRPMDTFYTRAGSFRKDIKGDLVNSSGLVIQGWELDVDGNQKAGGLTGINISTASNADPMPTSKAVVGVNLDSNTVAKSDDLIYSATDPATYDFSTSIRVYDSRGKGHNVEIQFRKLNTTDDNTWAWHAVTDEAGTGELKAVDLTATNVKDTPANATYTAGQLKFNSMGKLESEGSTPLLFNFSGAEPQEILFDFGDAIGAKADSTNDFSKKTLDVLYGAGTVAEDTDNTGGEGSIQVSSGFATLRLSQDGFPSGFLDKLAVNQDGILSGYYTNGQTKQLFQVALVDFNDELALEQAGSNLYKETVNSGLPRVGTAQSGRLGSILSNSLEQSNVDMSAEFVRMITTQRGFQANSRIVSVTDGMLEELISLKR